MSKIGKVVVLLGFGLLQSLVSYSTDATQRAAQPQQLVIIDTDIGDDIDDAFAVALALSSPELRVLGIEAAWGDTPLRSRLLSRFLEDTNHAEIPVATGIETKSPTPFSQAAWARRAPERAYPNAVDFLLGQIRQHPGEITLIAIAPLTNIGAAIQKDGATFRQLKRVVMMGGSIRKGYDDFGYTNVHQPSAEYNIAMDPEAARRLFASGVPLYVMPLDATQIKLDQVRRDLLFTRSTPLTDDLTLLYHQWSASTHLETPTLFDVMAVAYAIEPSLCPTTPLHVTVDEKGFTREGEGAANAQVCLSSESDDLLRFFMPRVVGQDK